LGGMAGRRQNETPGAPANADEPHMKPGGLVMKAKRPLRGPFALNKGSVRYERLSSMAFCSIWSAVVTTLLLD